MKPVTQNQETGNVVLTIILVLLIIVALVLVGIGIRRRHEHNKNVGTRVPTTALSSPNQGNNNGSLDTDLNGVNSSLNQGNQNLQLTGGAVNDGQQQITVPTN